MKNEKLQIDLKMVNGKLVATIKKEQKNCFPTMHDIKNSMWGKGKHSTKK